jgi:hypothetical protein
MGQCHPGGGSHLFATNSHRFDMNRRRHIVYRNPPRIGVSDPVRGSKPNPAIRRFGNHRQWGDLARLARQAVERIEGSIMNLISGVSDGGIEVAGSNSQYAGFARQPPVAQIVFSYAEYGSRRKSVTRRENAEPAILELAQTAVTSGPDIAGSIVEEGEDPTCGKTIAGSEILQLAVIVVSDVIILAKPDASTAIYVQISEFVVLVGLHCNSRECAMIKAQETVAPVE